MIIEPRLTIRPISKGDEADWRVLWRGYLDYYETVLPDEVYTTTFGRLIKGGEGEFRGYLALMGGRPVGLVHYLFHPSSWLINGTCYLQDLYTLPEARGAGVARALIQAVYEAADTAGVHAVYWFTQHFNATARTLYDKVAVKTPFIRYNRRFEHQLQSRPDLTIRPLVAADEDSWRDLWAGYLTFYDAELPEAVTTATFARLLADDPETMRGRILEVEGTAAGIVHFVNHSTCWKIEKVCYLQDLYAKPEYRGQGLGRALIEAVYTEADRMSTPTVYWLTQEFNATARRLYDRIGVLTPFIEYDRLE